MEGAAPYDLIVGTVRRIKGSMPKTILQIKVRPVAKSPSQTPPPNATVADLTWREGSAPALPRPSSLLEQFADLSKRKEMSPTDSCRGSNAIRTVGGSGS